MEGANAHIEEMLVSIGALAASDLSEARQIARTLKQPVLKVLIQSGFMTEEELNRGLERVRRLSQQVNRSAARTSSTHLQAVPKPAPTPAPAPAAPPQPSRVDSIIWSLLCDVGVVNTPSASLAAKNAASKGVPVELVLFESGQLQASMCETLGELRELLAKNMIQPLVAQEILRKVVARDIPVQRALAEMGLLRTDPQSHIKLGELLVLAGFVRQPQLEEALKLAVCNDTLIGKMLVICEMVSQDAVTNALQCQFLIRDGLLKVEQAIIALHYCERCRTTIDDALAQCA